MAQAAVDERLEAVRRALFDGRHEEAGQAIDAALAKHSENAGAWYLKGRLAHIKENPEEANDAFAQALSLKPRDPEIRYFWAEFLYRQGRHQESLDLLTNHLPKKKFAGDSRLLLGVLLKQQRRFKEAIKPLKEAARYDAFFVRASIQQSQCHLAAKNPTGAITVLRMALRKRPKDMALKEALALALHAGEKFQESDRLFAEVAATTKSPYDAELRIGAALYGHNDMERAVQHWTAAHELKPDEPAPLTNMGVAYRALHKYDLALDYMAKALERDPDCANTHNTMGNIYFEQDFKEKSVESFKKAIAIKPDFAMAYANCSRSLFDLRRFDEAVDFASKAIYMKDFDAGSVLFPLNVLERAAVFDDLDYLHGRIWDMLKEIPMYRLSGALLSLLCLSKSRKDKGRIFKLHCDWGDYISRQASLRPIARSAAPRDRGSDSKIRLGILSGDLRSHAVAKFAVPIFEHYDRNDFEVHCYSPYPGDPDAVQQRIIGLSTSFNRVHGLTHQEVAQKVHDDGMDMVIELNGFTRFSELESLAHRPAPVQISWLGYPFTYGIPEVDYLLLDDRVAPTNEGHLREQPLIMPESWICFATEQGSDAVRVGFEREPIIHKPPVQLSGKITFGTLNNPYKYSRALLKAWADIMHQVSGSEFLFVRPESSSQHFRDNMIKEFGRHGIDQERIRFTTNKPGKHLLCYNAMDISLDTFPQTGGTTTCESLWMGVPVISLVGEEVFERLSYGILCSAGAPELACFTVEDYVQRAVELANSHDRLVDYRAGLRDAILRSPMCETVKFVNALQIVLKQAWEKSMTAAVG